MPFQPDRLVNEYLRLKPASLRDISREIRDIVFDLCPSATETIDRGGISYHKADVGGPVKGAICALELNRDTVRLSFIHGARLGDPEGLLAGDRLSKRHIDLPDYDSVPWESVRALIAEAVNLDPATFGPL